MAIPIGTADPARRSPRFRTIRDSARMSIRILRFGASSLIAAAIDYGLLFALQALTGDLLLSVVGARVASASTNYALNRTLVFRYGRGTSVASSLPRYAVLAGAILALNYGLLAVLTGVAGFPLLPAKLLAESALYLLSYWAQRAIVFPGAKEGRRPAEQAAPRAR